MKLQEHRPKEQDLRKTFKAVRAKLVRLAEKKARKERKRG